jgi:hypothetical protein
MASVSRIETILRHVRSEPNAHDTLSARTTAAGLSPAPSFMPDSGMLRAHSLCYSLQLPASLAHNGHQS